MEQPDFRSEPKIRVKTIIDNLILVAVFVVSFAIFLFAENAPQAEAVFAELLWTVAFIPLVTVLMVAFRYRVAIVKHWTLPDVKRWLIGLVGLLVLGYGCIVIATQLCPLLIRIGWATQGVGLRIVFCGGGALAGYFAAGLATLVFIRYIMFLDQERSFDCKAVVRWWALWVPMIILVALWLLGQL